MKIAEEVKVVKEVIYYDVFPVPMFAISLVQASYCRNRLPTHEIPHAALWAGWWLVAPTQVAAATGDQLPTCPNLLPDSARDARTPPTP